jgi:alkanesulfonate monooxygenase SsuD/methylene tetrahydromethanopterin reductase-like flavin-dependent oxidoreductase (luciferase family)
VTELFVPPHHHALPDTRRPRGARRPDAAPHADLADAPDPLTGAAPPTGLLTLGLDLTALGRAPAPWTAGADEQRPEIDQQRVLDLTLLAERAALDFVAFDEDFALVPGVPRSTASRLDAARISCRLAPLTSRIGLVATLDTSYLDPVHVATAVTTLHAKSGGRAAWQVGVAQARLIGDTPEVWGRLAREIRTAAGERTAGDERDRAARPAVVVRAGSPHSVAVAGALADVVRVEALDAHHARQVRSGVRAAAAGAGRDPDSVRVLADVVVLVSPDAAAARARLDLLADLTVGEPAWRRTLSHLGNAGQLADLVEAWFAEGIVDGFTLLPGSLPHDVRALVGDVLPVLRERDLAQRPVDDD